jgi:cytochrome c oxidase subunit IV
MSETTAGAIDTKAESNLYLMIWAWLVFLLIAGLVIFVLPIPRTAAVITIFSLAAIKATLVLRNYMHLKHEHLILYLTVLVPALLFLGMALTLIPDIVYRHALGLGR